MHLTSSYNVKTTNSSSVALSLTFEPEITEKLFVLRKQHSCHTYLKYDLNSQRFCVMCEPFQQQEPVCSRRVFNVDLDPLIVLAPIVQKRFGSHTFYISRGWESC